MKKFIPYLFMLCLLVFFSCSKDTGPVEQQKDSAGGVRFVDLSIADALARAGTEGKIVLLDFFSPT